MAAADLIVTLRLKDNFSAALKGIGTTVRSIGSGIGGAFTSISSNVLTFKNLIIGLAAGGVMRSVTKSFMESESAAIRFDQTLKNTGRFTPAFSAAMTSLATSLEAVGTVSDDAVVAGMKFLALTDRLASRDLPRATRAAVDLAALLDGDVEQAFRLVSQAIEGQAGGLSRLGIRLDETVLKSGNVHAILSAIEAAAGGMDVRMRGTAEGGLKAVANQFDNLKERLGAFVAQVLQAGPFDFLRTFFEELAGDLAGANAQFAKDDAKAWGATVVTALKGVALTIGVVIDGVRLMIKGAVGAMTALGLVDDPIAKSAANVKKLGEEFALSTGIAKQFAKESGNALAAEAAEEATLAGVRLEAATTAHQAILDVLGVGLGEYRTAVSVISEAIAGTEARMRGLGEASAEAGRKAVEAAAAAARAVAPVAIARITPVDLTAFKEEADAITAANEKNAASAKKWLEEMEALNEETAETARRGTELGDAFDQSVVQMQDFQNAVDFGPLTAATIRFNRELKDGTADSTAAATEHYRDFLEEASFGAIQAAQLVTNTIKQFADAVASFVGTVLDKAFEGQIRTIRDVAEIALDVMKNLVKQITQELVRIAVTKLVVGAATGFAKGGIIQGGIEPIPSAAGGGVFRGPQMVQVGDNPSRIEAAVPLEDGRNIPVRIDGGQDMGRAGPVIVNFNIQAIDAASFAQKMVTREAQESIRAAVAEGVATRPEFRRQIGSRG